MISATQAEPTRVLVLSLDKNVLARVTSLIAQLQRYEIVYDPKALRSSDLVLMDAETRQENLAASNVTIVPFFANAIPPRAATWLASVTPEPPLPLFGNNAEQILTGALNRVVTQVRMRRLAPNSRDSLPMPSSSRLVERGHEIAFVVLGISTGGPEALSRVLPELSPQLRAPIIVVQHMHGDFIRGFSSRLNEKSRLPVLEATPGTVPLPGHAYIAPGGRHTTIRTSRGTPRFHLNERPPVHNCRPSVDVLLESLAKAHLGQHTVSCIMTGMGTDGAVGTRLVKEQGAYVVVQSKESCAIWGMPRAVEEANLHDIVLPLERIASHLNAMLDSPLLSRRPLPEEPGQ